MSGSGRQRRKRLRLYGRPRMWAGGLLVVMAIAVFGALGVRPLVSGRREDKNIRNVVQVLQKIADLRTALAAWQVYIEPHFTDFSALPAKLDPQDLARGAVFAATQATRALDVIRQLPLVGLAPAAHTLRAANTEYTKSIAAFATLDGGASTAAIEETITAETAAYTQMVLVTSDAGTALRSQTNRGLEVAIDRLDTGRRVFLIADAIAATLAVAAALVLGQRVRRRELAQRSVNERQAYENTLQDALEMAKTETDAYVVMTDALRDSVPDLQVEMLVADSSHAHFHQTLHTPIAGTANIRSGCAVVSPRDCPATRRGHTLVFPTSTALNACPYLKERPSGELAAACVPVSITGQTAGVVHATATDHAPPDDRDLHYLELTSRLASERIAMLRAFEKSEAQARTDPLTGLWNRRSLENRIHDLQREGTPYALAYGDLDNFKILNDTHGHEAGDQALRLFARVLRDSVRPDDITARYGGEEFVVVLPNCTVATAANVLERLRERLVLALTTGRVAPFTVSFGLASSLDADTFDEIVACADRALLRAKAAGRNRTVLAAEPAADEPAHAES